MIKKTESSVVLCKARHSTKRDLKAYIVSSRETSIKQNKTAQKVALTCSEEQPLFFKKDKAFTYAKFMRQDGMILEVYVPEKAIIGRLDKLTIKPKNIDKSRICKFFPDLMNQEQYILNEEFLA